MKNSKMSFFKYLESIGYDHIRYGEKQIDNWKKQPVIKVQSLEDNLPMFSTFGPTDCFFTINGDKDTEIKYGISEGIVLDTHVTVRSPLPFEKGGCLFIDREVMDIILKTLPADVIYKSMFGEKLNINVWSKTIKDDIETFTSVLKAYNL